MDIQPRRVFDSHPLAMPDIPDSLGLRLTRHKLPVEFAQSHSPLHNSLVPGQVQLVEHLLCIPLLGELHLRPSLLNRLAADLPGQMHKLLGARSQPGRRAQHHALRPLQPLIPRLLAPDVQRARDLPNDHLTLPPPPALGIRVHGVPYMLRPQARAHHGLLLLQPVRRVLLFRGLFRVAVLYLGGVLYVLFEDGRRVHADGRHALAERGLDLLALFAVLGVVERLVVQVLGLVAARDFLGFAAETGLVGGRRAGLGVQEGERGRGEGRAEGFEDRRSWGRGQSIGSCL